MPPEERGIVKEEKDEEVVVDGPASYEEVETEVFIHKGKHGGLEEALDWFKEL